MNTLWLTGVIVVVGIWVVNKIQENNHQSSGPAWQEIYPTWQDKLFFFVGLSIIVYCVGAFIWVVSFFVV